MEKFKSQINIVNGRPVSTFPSMSEYDMAKKNLEVGIDMTDYGEKDKSVYLVVDVETLACLYWSAIPEVDKKKIQIGDCHDDTYFQSLQHNK
jgi:hypothetical protein